VYGVVVVMVMVKVDFFLIFKEFDLLIFISGSDTINWRLEGFFYFLFVLGDLLTHTHETATDKGGDLIDEVEFLRTL